MRKFIERSGEIHGNLQIIKELGENKVQCRCIKCEYEDVYTKNHVVNGKALCSNCGIHKIKANKIGDVYGTLKVIQELGHQMILCKCTNCGHQDNYKKNEISRSKNRLCKRCRTNLKSISLGKIFGTLKILEDIDRHKVKCECIKCNHIDTYDKSGVYKEATNCKACGLAANYSGRVI